MKLKNFVVNINKVLNHHNTVYNAANIFKEYYNNYDLKEIQTHKLELQKTNLKPYYYNKKTLFQNNDFELVLINWGEYASSPIHDHPECGCLSVVLEGNLTEYLFDKNLYLKTYRNLYPGRINYIDNDKGYHKIVNNYNYSDDNTIKDILKKLNNTDDYNLYQNNSLSLHLYSPPNYPYGVFNENSNSLKIRNKIEKEENYYNENSMFYQNTI